MTTETGSIDSKLHFDIDEFMERAAIVKREARSLGQEHPTIDVEANTGKAQASMAAVDAAAKAMGQSAATAGERVKRSATDVSAAQAKVAAANQAADVAYEKARIAQMRFSEAQENGRTKASTMAAAQLAAAEALGRLEKANARATAAEVALKEAQEDAANGALKQAAAEEVAAKATDNAGNAASRANARTQLIIAAVVGLTAVAAPLTGALLGVAGGLAGLGAAGVLGIIGAVQAIKQGTQAGAEWSDGLKTLKSDMSALSATAAGSVLTSFQRAVALINRDMPELNSEVGGFARILGGAAVTGLQAVITAFHILNPLFMQGAGLIYNIASGFESWVSNGGLQKFAAYAQSELPQVIDTVGALAAAILHIAEATAPIGSVVLGTLEGLGNAINAIPVPVLTVIAAAAIAGYTGFMLWKGVTAVINGVKAAADTLGLSMKGLAIAGGAVGIALTALVLVFTAVAQANAEANARAQAYTDTLDKTTGATTEASRKMAVDALNAKQGFLMWQTSAYDAAAAIGISAKTMTDAYMGVPSAVKQVTAAMQDGYDQGKLNGVQLDVLQNTLKQGSDMASAAADSFRNNAAAMGDAGSAAADTRLTAQGAADAFQKEASAADDAMNKLNGLIDATNRLNGIGQSAEETNARWQKSLAGISEEAQRQRDAFEQANGTLDGFTLSLDANTSSGSANRSMLTGAASDAQAATKAQFDLDVQTMSSKDATDKYASTLAAQRQAFIDSAVGAGFNAEQVQALTDKVFAMPSEKQLNILANTSAAQNVIDSFINRNDGRTVTIYTSVQGQYSQVDGQLGKSIGWAYGGTVPGAAYGITGGTIRGNGSAWSDTAGMYRLANGEEVISNTVGQAARSRALLKAINRGDSPVSVAGQAMRVAGINPSVPAVFGMPQVGVSRGQEGPVELSDSSIDRLARRLAGLMPSGPVDLSASSIDRFTRSLGAQSRVQTRQGV
ncbi:hypothetical protein [Microbacterium sp. 22242]|uniref:hypothetical protein n=1 Tax=Microbacterium sp. 22242 TaxID=3453896 RepID=UPI003F82F5AB